MVCPGGDPAPQQLAVTMQGLRCPAHHASPQSGARGTRPLPWLPGSRRAGAAGSMRPSGRTPPAPAPRGEEPLLEARSGCRQLTGEVGRDEEEGGAEEGEAHAQGPLGLDLGHDARGHRAALHLCVGGGTADSPTPQPEGPGQPYCWVSELVSRDRDRAVGPAGRGRVRAAAYPSRTR